jgi:hypothetical protein
MIDSYMETIAGYLNVLWGNEQPLLLTWALHVID